ncbi:hypothetical protein [Streptacidiphilus carbonis]|jgi:hypothetical protein|uniref:hypothetical protein n=1 Tax=Streptacidiphilus carbonis TaxID=105422 RepID=UPI0005AB4BC0|nr:hypothetical protein [Streptacidiphilus carbonis]
MAEILVEENFVRIDGDDMNALLRVLHGVGLEAEPTAPRDNDTGVRWELAAHWLGAAFPSAETVAALNGAFGEIHAYFVTEGKIPPSRVILYGPESEALHVFEPEPA